MSPGPDKTPRLEVFGGAQKRPESFIYLGKEKESALGTLELVKGLWKRYVELSILRSMQQCSRSERGREAKG